MGGSRSASNACGDNWVTGVVAASRFPTDNMGAGSATASASLLHAAKRVLITGFWVSNAAAAGVIEAVDEDGTTIPGATLTLSATTPLGFYPLGEGIEWIANALAVTANVGVKLSGAANAGFMAYRRLE
jgi:hypothetical protein